MIPATPDPPGTLRLAPFAYVWPLYVHDCAAATLHDGYWYEPESVPLEHVRVCEAHEEPDGTLDA